MAKPSSTDLRDRVVACVASGETALCSVSVSSVVKWSQRRRATGGAAAKPMGGRRRDVMASGRACARERLAAKPSLTLASLRRERAERGVQVSHGALWACVRRKGMSFKKDRAAQRAGPAGDRAAPGAVAQVSGQPLRRRPLRARVRANPPRPSRPIRKAGDAADVPARQDAHPRPPVCAPRRPLRTCSTGLRSGPSGRMLRPAPRAVQGSKPPFAAASANGRSWRRRAGQGHYNGTAGARASWPRAPGASPRQPPADRRSRPAVDRRSRRSRSGRLV